MSFTEHNVNGVIFDTAGTLSVGGVRHAFTTRHGGVSPAPVRLAQPCEQPRRP